MSDEPRCGKCGGVMTPVNARIRPELFYHDACLPDEFKPKPQADAPAPPRVLRVGLYGSVVTDEPTGAHEDEANRKAYGGNIFCETITPTNAAELVRRWNAFDGLVAALKAFVRAAEIPSAVGGAVAAERALPAAVAALAAAEDRKDGK